MQLSAVGVTVEGVGVVGRRWARFGGLWLLVTLLGATFSTFVATFTDDVLAAQSDVLLQDGLITLWGSVLFFVELGLPVLLVTFLLLSLGAAATTVMADDVLADRATRVRKAIRVGAPRAVTILLTLLTTVLAVLLAILVTPLAVPAGLLGLLLAPLLRRLLPSRTWPDTTTLLLLAIPFAGAVLIGLRWALAVPAVALEGRTVRDALGRSAELTRGHLRVVALAVLGGVGLQLLAVFASRVLAAAELSDPVSSVVAFAVPLLAVSIPFAVLTVLFRRLAPSSGHATTPTQPNGPVTPAVLSGLGQPNGATVLVLIAALAASSVAVLPRPAAAVIATITVNDLGDDTDNNPGDGTCLADSGGCTLRAALVEAAFAPGADVIGFSVSGTLYPFTPLVIDSPVGIDGAGQTIRIAGNGCITYDDCTYTGVSILSAMATVADGFVLRNLTIRNGIASGMGAGLESAATGLVENVTFDFLESDVPGAAVTVRGGHLNLVNTTFSDNTAPSGADVWVDGAASVATIRFSTLARATGGSVAVSGGATATVEASIIAPSSGTACLAVSAGSLPNVDSDGSCPSSTPVGTLSLLGDNTGLVQTIAIDAASNAVDAVPIADCVATDARGVSRSATTCDLGSYEFLGLSRFDFVVNSVGDESDATDDFACETAVGNGICTLRAAIEQANLQPTLPTTIGFNGGLAIVVASSLFVRRSLTINGTGAVVSVSGGGGSQILDVDTGGVVLTLTDLHLTSGSTNDPSGGAALRSIGTLTLSNVTISDSQATAGGGHAIAVLGGSMSMVNGTLDGNGGGTGHDITVASGASADLVHTTIRTAGGALQADAGATPMRLQSSIVEAGAASACDGTITGGDNRVTDASCPGTVDADPGLDLFGLHGGFVPSIALLTSSSAIDAASVADCPAADARGIVRPQLDGCDAGSYEIEGVAGAADFLVTDFGDAPDADLLDGVCDVGLPGNGCTLRAAIEQANARTAASPVDAPAFTVTFDGPGTIDLGASLELLAAMTIDGGTGGVTIDGGDAHEVFVIGPSNRAWTLRNLTVANGRSARGGAGVRSSAPGTVTNVTFISNVTEGSPPGEGGGAIAALASTLSVVNTTFSRNTSPHGGSDILAAVPVQVRNATLFDSFGGRIAGPVDLVNTLIIYNRAPTCGTGTTGHDNIQPDDTCADHAGVDTNPLVGTFGDHGGPVHTLGLLPTSAALDAGDPAACPATDARGIARDASCDIGASEYVKEGSLEASLPASTAFGVPFDLVATHRATYDEGAASGTVTVTSDVAGEPVRDGVLVDGEVTIPMSGMAVGVHNLTVALPTDGFFPASQAIVQHTVRSAVQLDLEVDPVTAVFGQDVTLTATISDAAATGDVDFTSSAGPVLSATLIDGVATLVTSSLPVGEQDIVASHTGDVAVPDTASDPVTLTIDAAPTSLVLDGPTASTYGTSVTFTADVTADAPSGATPAGTVTFFDGLTAIGVPVTLVAGRAEVATANLLVGARNISAVYAPSSSFVTSQDALGLAVSAATTTTTITGPATSTGLGQLATFDVAVTRQVAGDLVPQGTAVFLVDGVEVDRADLDADGEASFATSSLAAGERSIRVDYLADAGFVDSEDVVLHTVTSRASNIVLSGGSSGVLATGSTTTWSVVVTDGIGGGPVPTGDVTLTFGSVEITTALDAAGRASFTFETPPLAGGSTWVTGRYLGDGLYGESVDVRLQDIAPAEVGVTVRADPVSTVPGGSVDIIVELTPPAGGTPTGLVVLHNVETGARIGEANVLGQRTFTFTAGTSAVPLGRSTIRATYTPDPGWAWFGTSPTALVFVNTAVPDLVLTLSPALPERGTRAIASLAVGGYWGPARSGTVQFFVDGLRVGEVDVRLAGAGVGFDVGDVGSRRVEALFNGNDIYGARSVVRTVEVQPTPTLPQVNWNRRDGTWGIDVWNASLVAGTFHGATPAGQVSLWVDGVRVARGVLVSQAPLPLGTAVLEHVLEPGLHEVTVRFEPAVGFAASQVTANYDIDKFTGRLIIDDPGEVPWGQIEIGGKILPDDADAPAPTGVITYVVGGSSCTAPAAGGTCLLEVDLPGDHLVTASYPGDTNWPPADGSRTITVVRKEPDVVIDVTAPLLATGEPVTVHWSIEGPTEGEVRTEFGRIFNRWVTECTAGLSGQCTAVFPYTSSFTYVPDVRVSHPGDDLWLPVEVVRPVPVTTCFVVTLQAQPATASLTAEPPPNCNAGRGYLDGTVLTVTATAPPGVPQQWSMYWDREYYGNRDGGERVGRPMTVGWANRHDWVTGQHGQRTAVRHEAAHCVLVTIEVMAYRGWVDPVLPAEPDCPADLARARNHPEGWRTGTEYLLANGERILRPGLRVNELRQIKVARGWFALGSVLPAPTFSTRFVRPSEDLLYGWSIDGAPVAQLPGQLVAGLSGLTVGATFGPVCVPISFDAGEGGTPRIDTDPNCSNWWGGLDEGWLAGTDVSVSVLPDDTRYMLLPSFASDWSANLVCRGCLDGFDRLQYNRSARVAADGTLRADRDGLPKVPTPEWRSCRELVIDSQGSSPTELVMYNISGSNGRYNLSCPNRSANDGWHADGERLTLRVRAQPGYLFGIWNDEELDAVPVPPFGRDQFESPLITPVMDRDLTLRPSFFTTEECTNVRASVQPRRQARVGTQVTSLLVDVRDFVGGTVCPNRNVGKGPAEEMAGLLRHTRLTLAGMAQGGAALSGWSVWGKQYPAPELPPTAADLAAGLAAEEARIAAQRASEKAAYEVELAHYNLRFSITPQAFRFTLPPPPVPPAWMTEAAPAAAGPSLSITGRNGPPPPAAPKALDPPSVSWLDDGSVGLNLDAYDAGQAVFAVCQEVVAAYTVELADGQKTLGIDERQKLMRITPEPNCPFQDDAWLVGTNIALQNVAPSGTYRLTRLGGRPNTNVSSFRLAAEAPTVVKFGEYQFICHTLDVNRSVKLTPEPNCPNTEAGERRYAAGTEVFIEGDLPRERVREGWSGDDIVLLAEGDTLKNAPVVMVLMDRDRFARFNFRAMTDGEILGNFFEEAGRAITTGVVNALKKATGGLALGMKLYVMDNPPISYMLKPGEMFDALGGLMDASAWVSTSVLDLLGVKHPPIGKPFCPPNTPPGGKDCSWFPKDIDATLAAMDALVEMSLSGATCTAVWGMSGSGSYAGQAVTLIEELAGLASSVKGGLTDGYEAAAKARLLVKRQEAFLATVELAQQAYAAQGLYGDASDVLTDPNNEGTEGEFESFEDVVGEIQFDRYDSLTDLSAMAQCVGEQLEGTQEALAAIGL